MNRVAAWLVVPVVLALLACGSPGPLAPTPASFASAASAVTPEPILLGPAEIGPAAPAPAVATALALAATAQPTPTPSLERVSLPSARLKPRPEVSPAAGPRETPVGLPKTLRIPAIGVETTFEYVGLTAEGAMDVPKDPNKAAWYQLGPRPGERGNAVIAGHVDWGGKLAVFWGLKDLKPGDLVEVVAADDKKYEYAVQWLRWVDARSASAEEAFRQTDLGEITLITCGGQFDRSTRQYLSRLVVRGVLR